MYRRLFTNRVTFYKYSFGEFVEEAQSSNDGRYRSTIAEIICPVVGISDFIKVPALLQNIINQTITNSQNVKFHKTYSKNRTVLTFINSLVFTHLDELIMNYTLTKYFPMY